MPVPPSKQVMLSLLKPKCGHRAHHRHAVSMSLCLMDPRNGYRWPYSKVSFDIYSDSCFIIRPRSMGVLSRRAVGFWDMVQRFFVFLFFFLFGSSLQLLITKPLFMGAN